MQKLQDFVGFHESRDDVRTAHRTAEVCTHIPNTGCRDWCWNLWRPLSIYVHSNLPQQPVNVRETKYVRPPLSHIFLTSVRNYPSVPVSSAIWNAAIINHVMLWFYSDVVGKGKKNPIIFVYLKLLFKIMITLQFLKTFALILRIFRKSLRYGLFIENNP